MVTRRTCSRGVVLTTFFALTGAAGCHAIFGDFEVAGAEAGGSGGAGAGAGAGATGGGGGSAPAGGGGVGGVSGAGGGGGACVATSTPAMLCQGRLCSEAAANECGEPVSCGPCNEWLRTFVSTQLNSSRAFGVAADGDGRVIVTGQCGGETQYGGAEPVACPPGGGVFVWKLDGSGDPFWAKAFGVSGAGGASTIDKIGRGVATSKVDDGFVVGGTFGDGALDIGLDAGPLPSFGAQDVFVAKFNGQGKALWGVSLGSADINDNVTDVATHPLVDKAVALVSGAPTSLVGCPPPALYGNTDVVVFELTQAGACAWVKTFGGGDFDGGAGLAYSPDGAHLFVSGVVNASALGGPKVDFGGGCEPVDGAFVAKLSALDGTCVWAKGFGAEAQMKGVAVDKDANVWLTGTFRTVVDLGGGPLQASNEAGANDLFVAKFDRDGGHRYSQRFGDALDQTVESIAVDGAGNVLVTGFYFGTFDFGGDALTNPNLTLSQGNSNFNSGTFLAKLDPNGRHVWSKGVSGPAGAGPNGFVQSHRVAVDASGNSFVAGQGQGLIDFGSGVASTEGTFVTKFSP